MQMLDSLSIKVIGNSADGAKRGNNMSDQAWVWRQQQLSS